MTKNNNFKKEIVKLSPDQIKTIRVQKEQMQLQVESLEIALESSKKQVELDIPARNARLQLRDLQDQSERMAKNLKVLEKQLRTGTVTHLVPKK